MKYKLICFGFGAIAGGVAGIANSIFSTPLTFLFFERPDLSMLILACIVAPIVEETCKPIGLYLIRMEEKPYLSISTWTVLGTLAGLGFGLIENLSYAFQTIVLGGGNVTLLYMALRTLLSLPLHMIVTTLTGFGMALWLRTNETKYVIYFIAIAMVLHGLFNFTALNI